MLPPENLPVQGRRTRPGKDLWPLTRQVSGRGSAQARAAVLDGTMASGPAGAYCRQAHTGSDEASPRRVPALLVH